MQNFEKELNRELKKAEKEIKRQAKNYLKKEAIKNTVDYLNQLQDKLNKEWPSDGSEIPKLKLTGAKTSLKEDKKGNFKGSHSVRIEADVDDEILEKVKTILGDLLE